MTTQRPLVHRSVARDVQWHMSDDVRRDYTRILRDLHRQMKAAKDPRPSMREALGSRIEELAPEVRLGIETFMGRDETGPGLGDKAPDFYLKRLESEERVRLSGYRGKRPVALAFGSYT